MIGIEPDERRGRCDVDPVGDGGHFFQRREAGVEPVGKHIGEGGEAHAGIGLEGLKGGAGAAPAAADEANLNDRRSGSGRICGATERGGGDEAADGDGGRIAEEVAAGEHGSERRENARSFEDLKQCFGLFCVQNFLVQRGH